MSKGRRNTTSEKLTVCAYKGCKQGLFKNSRKRFVKLDENQIYCCPLCAERDGAKYIASSEKLNTLSAILAVEF